MEGLTASWRWRSSKGSARGPGSHGRLLAGAHRSWAGVGGRQPQGLLAGLALGAALGAIGFLRVLAWDAMFHTYGVHALRIGVTVWVSLMCVVVLGTLAGSMLPLVLHRLGFDPASASAPFVATLVDVTGLMIYFSVASVVLGGALV